MTKSPMLKALEDLEKFSLIKASKSLENSSLITVFKSLELLLMIKAIKSFEDAPAMREFSDMASKIRSTNLGPLPFTEAFQIVFQTYDRARKDDVSEPWEKVVTELEMRTIDPPKGSLGAEFYLSLVLTLIMLLLSQKLGSFSEQRILSKIQALDVHIRSN